MNVKWTQVELDEWADAQMWGLKWAFIIAIVVGIVDAIL